MSSMNCAIIFNWIVGRYWAIGTLFNFLHLQNQPSSLGNSFCQNPWSMLLQMIKSGYNHDAVSTLKRGETTEIINIFSQMVLYHLTVQPSPTPIVVLKTTTSSTPIMIITAIPSTSTIAAVPPCQFLKKLSSNRCKWKIWRKCCQKWKIKQEKSKE